MVMKDEVFSLMELAFVPLKPQQKLQAAQGKEEFYEWKQLNTFEKQWRPFVVGTLNSRDDRQRHKCTEVY